MLLTLPATVRHSDGLKRHAYCSGAMESWIKSKADQLAQAQHIVFLGGKGEVVTKNVCERTQIGQG